MQLIAKNLASIGRLLIKDMIKNKPAKMTPDQAFHHGVESAVEKDGFSRNAFFGQKENFKAYRAGYASIDPNLSTSYR